MTIITPDGKPTKPEKPAVDPVLKQEFMDRYHIKPTDTFYNAMMSAILKVHGELDALKEVNGEKG